MDDKIEVGAKVEFIGGQGEEQIGTVVGLRTFVSSVNAFGGLVKGAEYEMVDIEPEGDKSRFTVGVTRNAILKVLVDKPVEKVEDPYGFAEMFRQARTARTLKDMEE